MEHSTLERIGRDDRDDNVHQAQQQSLRDHLEGVKQIDRGTKLKAQKRQDNRVSACKHLADIHIHIAQKHAKRKRDQQRNDLVHLRHTEARCAEEAQEQQRQQRHGADEHHAEAGFVGLVAKGLNDSHVQRGICAGDGTDEGQKRDAEHAVIAEGQEEQCRQRVGNAQPHKNQQNAAMQRILQVAQPQRRAGAKQHQADQQHLTAGGKHVLHRVAQRCPQVKVEHALGECCD